MSGEQSLSSKSIGFEIRLHQTRQEESKERKYSNNDLSRLDSNLTFTEAAVQVDNSQQTNF